MNRTNLTVIATTVAVALMSTGCSKKASGSSDSKSSGENDSDSVKTEAIEPVKETPLQVTAYSAELGESKLSIQYPMAGPEALVNAVRKWENDRLAATFEDHKRYTGDMADSESFFNFYKGKMYYNTEGWEEYQTDNIKMASQSKFCTTFVYENYTYSGGAHGMGIEFGTTFRNSDGAIFTMADIDVSNPGLADALAKGLMEYFQASSFDELAQNLMIGEAASPTDIPMPSIDPWISGDMLILTYGSYEIAPYSAGYPTAKIPLSVAKAFLTPNGKTFIE